MCGDSQLTVWAITSISELAIASYSEDVYGVVQRVRETRQAYLTSAELYSASFKKQKQQLLLYRILYGPKP